MNFLADLSKELVCDNTGAATGPVRFDPTMATLIHRSLHRGRDDSNPNETYFFRKEDGKFLKLRFQRQNGIFRSELVGIPEVRVVAEGSMRWELWAHGAPLELIEKLFGVKKI